MIPPAFPVPDVMKVGGLRRQKVLVTVGEEVLCQCVCECVRERERANTEERHREAAAVRGSQTLEGGRRETDFGDREGQCCALVCPAAVFPLRG